MCMCVCLCDLCASRENGDVVDIDRCVTHLLSEQNSKRKIRVETERQKTRNVQTITMTRHKGRKKSREEGNR